MNIVNSTSSHLSEEDVMTPLAENQSRPEFLKETQHDAVTEPPPHQPDKAPSDKEKNNDQQQQTEGEDPPHPPNAPFSEPDIAPN